MKRVGELMKDLGFREEASAETAAAFIENLVRAATGEKWTSSKQFTRKPMVEAPQEEEQLSFDFGDVTTKTTRRSS